MINVSLIDSISYPNESSSSEASFEGIPNLILITEKEYFELKNAVGYWKSLHHRAREREDQLKLELLAKDAENRDLRQRVFGKKSEKRGSGRDQNKEKSAKSTRPKGQQRNSKGHRRTQYPELGVIDEKVSVAKKDGICPKCGKPYCSFGTEESEIIEIDVKAHKRRIIRERKKKSCSCKNVAETVTAPPVPRIIPKSPYGISIWVEILLNKFIYCQPTHRQLQTFKELGLPISAGTITGGLKKLVAVFEPVYNALYEHQMTEDRFHSDESSWKVFEAVEGKIGHQWWLWVSKSDSVVFFQIATSRGADVPGQHFFAVESDKIILVCDRYSSYKAMAKQLEFITLAFCWAHVRRDFLDTARKFPQLETWALTWTEMIGDLYHINNQRCLHFNKELPVAAQSTDFTKYHCKLLKKMEQMCTEFESFLEQPGKNTTVENIVLHEAKEKVLTSLKNHWKGLSVFAQHPLVPMDNNFAERAVRNPVTGRKNYYGSGSIWSSELAAMLFSIFQTVKLWDLNCRHWLNVYLTACANNKGRAPEDLSSFLPWKMDENCLHGFSKPFNTS